MVSAIKHAATLLNMLNLVEGIVATQRHNFVWVTGKNATQVVVLRCREEDRTVRLLYIHADTLHSDTLDWSSDTTMELVGKVARFLA